MKLCARSRPDICPTIVYLALLFGGSNNADSRDYRDFRVTYERSISGARAFVVFAGGRSTCIKLKLYVIVYGEKRGRLRTGLRFPRKTAETDGR